MTDLLIYQGKTAVALVAFYVFYRLLLSKETFHRFNRIVLLGTAAMAFVLPLCVITISKTVILPAVSPVETVTEVAEGFAPVVAEAYQEPIWPTVLLCIFLIGALAVLMMTVVSIIKVKSIIRSGKHQLLDSGETLVITENDTAPFSWMKYIVLSREDYESGYSQILTHEKAHIALRHSWDLLFVDLITVLQWFNPVIWMLKSDLRALHEFEADDAVLRSGANIKEYQYLLIKKAVSKSGYSVANSFNHSTLKARITMMLNKKSSRMSAWKALYVLPLVGISLAATAETKVDYQYEDQESRKASILAETKVNDTPVDKDSKKSFKEKNMMGGRFIIDEDAKSVTMIYFDHEGNEMRSTILGLDLNNMDLYFVNGNMSTPRAFEMRMEEEDVVLLTGYLKNGKKVRGAVLPNNNYVTGTWDVNKDPDNQETVYHMNGKKYKTTNDNRYVEIKESVPFQLAGQKPTFNGGDANEFSKWVNQNLRYPAEARQAKVQGRVTLKFTVTETGKVTDVGVLRGVNEFLDKEAVRVVSESPLWSPGMDENGEAVPVTFTFPVIFRLTEDTTHQQKPSIAIRGRDENGEDIEVSKSDIVFVINGERMPEDFDLNSVAPETIVSMEVLKTEDVLKEYGTDKGVIKMTVDPSKKGQELPKHNIYIDGKKATSEEVAALPSNPKGSIAEDGTTWITTKDGADENPQNIAPSFNGGTNVDFAKWVQANVRYPEGTSAKGRVSVSFTVSETGEVTDVKALAGPDQKLNDEAVRVISSSPDWAPALKDGKPIAIKLVIPVDFKK